MILFVDSSRVIRAATSDGPPFDGWAEAEIVFASRLARLEVARTLNRLRIELHLSADEIEVVDRALAQIARRIVWLPLDERVLDLAAEPTPFHVKSLAAIHLATARLLRDAPTPGLIFATHDRQLGLAAVAMGFEVAGV